MKISAFVVTARVGVAVVALGLFFAGCQKTTTTTATPNGTVTTTTLSASAKASEAFADADAKVGAVAARVGEKVDDATLTAKIKSALLVEPGLKSLDVKVETQDGVVSISGTADNAVNAAHIARMVRETPGVKSVRNNLVVQRDS